MATSQPSGSTTSSTSATLFPALEAKPAPLDEASKYKEIIRIEKDLVESIRRRLKQPNAVHPTAGAREVDKLQNLLIPSELVASGPAKNIKPKVEPLVKRIRELPSEDRNEEEEEADEDEENEDEEKAIVEDEEDDAGGDYLVSHFDNGEGFEDNEDEGDDMNSMY